MSTQGTADIGGLAGWTVDLMERLGGPGAGLAILLENVFPPLPSEVILPMAGFAAKLGRLSVVEAIVWTTVGSVVGAWIIYFLGAWLGHTRMRTLMTKMPLIDDEDIDRSAQWFARHGTKGVFFGRMLPFFRSFISVPAGTERMNFVVFTVLTTLGSLIWNCVFIGAGYGLGANWHLVEPYASTFQTVVMIGVIVLVGWFIAGRVRRRKARAGQES
ncbi:DedA family protein [Mycolicibacterium gilvum]|uniref:Putative membrane-associated protein n=1 Tax=Mycolicibacterium gilvum TaxID=1804 RepID=A0A378SGN9_9MYCO|nr:DedA family protein [Mycolicibacterium gilvum]MCV7059039.1 DedA family protein [Mycolicibacterium gilvum]STZ41545.1 putative membrane-associated protein [Mycolicibacterium gilvum]